MTLVILAFAATSASAATAAPGWTLDSFATPTNFSAGETAECPVTDNEETVARRRCDSYEVTATNAGSEPTDGGPVTLTDTLPEGVTVAEDRMFVRTGNQGSGQVAENEQAKEYCTGEGVHCQASTRVVTCTVPTRSRRVLGSGRFPRWRLMNGCR